MTTITTHNNGPVRDATFSNIPSSGLYVFRGRNGVGKSETLKGLSALVGSGKERPSVSDRALKCEIVGWGAKLSVAKSTRRSGTLEVVGLEGLSIADLVDPGLKDGAAADAHRIKALVALTGQEPQPSLFFELVGGEHNFDTIVHPDKIKGVDLVTLAARVKSACEAAARQSEGECKAAEAKEAAKREGIKGINLAAEDDAAKLQAAFQAASARDGQLKAEARAAGEAIARAATARAELQQAEAKYDGPTIEQAKAGRQAAEESVKLFALDIAEAERKLAELRATQRDLNAVLANRIASFKAAEQHAAAMATWRAQVDAASQVEPIDAELLEESTAAVEVSARAMEMGAVIRRAKAELEKADVLAREADEARKQAEALREAAKGTDEVLSGVVGSLNCGLRVEDGRLVTDTGRGPTLFCELSRGEKWKAAIDLAVDVIGATGVIILEQEAFEGLDPPNRAIIHEHALARGVLIVTAECSDDKEIVGDVFDAAWRNP